MSRPPDPFPSYITLKDTAFVFDYFDMKFFDEAHSMFMEAAEMGDGYVKDEVEKGAMYKLITRGGKINAMHCVEERTGELVGVLIWEPCRLARSENPLCNGGRSVVKPKYRGMRVLNQLNRLLLQVSLTYGCLGMK